ncbi:hypothetical protein CP533_6357 [Ophiocordyceps camponoti-saundersi (nom. inval.)]|nr:hypothetical protein CP533_6357 [Ophiocordyceps camponoti-saundersi (nom. inval.)]
MKGLAVLSLYAVLASGYQYYPPGADVFSNYLANVSSLGHRFSEPTLMDEWGDKECENAMTVYVRSHGLIDPFCKMVIETGKLDIDGVLQGLAATTAYHVRQHCKLNHAARVCRVLQSRGVVGPMDENGSFCLTRLRTELRRDPSGIWEFCRDHIVNNLMTHVDKASPTPRTEVVFGDCFHSQFELARACEMVESPEILGAEQCASISGFYHVVLLFGNTLNQFCQIDSPEANIPYRIEKALERKTRREARTAVRDSCRCHNQYGHDLRLQAQDRQYGNDDNFHRNQPNWPGSSHHDQPNWSGSSGSAGINRRQDWNDPNRNQPSWSNRNRPAGTYGRDSWQDSNRPAGTYGRDGWQDPNRPGSYNHNQQPWPNRGDEVSPGSRSWNNPNRPGFHNQQPWSGSNTPGVPGMRNPWSGPGMTPHGYGGTPYVPQGPVLTEADVEKLLQLSKMFKFEIRSGLFAIQDMPQQARDAGVSWRLVYDLDVDVDAKTDPRLRFELCDAREQGRVVTKIRDQYVYGYPLEVNGQALATASISPTGQNELLCDNGDLTYVKIKDKSVSGFRPVEEAIAAKRRGQFIKCDDINKCQESRCQGDACSFNLVASVTVEGKAGGSAAATATATATAAAAAAAATDAATATATARASFKFDFEPCQTPTTCNCVRTCAENNNCMVQRPTRGLAPAPVPREQVRGATVADLAHVIAAAKAGHSDRGVYGTAEAEAGFERGDGTGLRGSRGAGIGPGFDGSMFPGDDRAGVAHVEVQGEVRVGSRPSNRFNTTDRFGNKGLGQQPGWNPSDDRPQTPGTYDNIDGNVVIAASGRVAVAFNILVGAVGLAVLL